MTSDKKNRVPLIPLTDVNGCCILSWLKDTLPEQAAAALGTSITLYDQGCRHGSRVNTNAVSALPDMDKAHRAQLKADGIKNSGKRCAADE